MPVDGSLSSSLSVSPTSPSHRPDISSHFLPNLDPANVDSDTFYTYVPNTIKTLNRTTPAQLEILEDVFVSDKKPSAPRRNELAKRLQMSPTEIKAWFQNSRAKEKQKQATANKVPPATSPLSFDTTPLAIAIDVEVEKYADPIPPPPVTKVKRQTPQPSPRTPQDPSGKPPRAASTRGRYDWTNTSTIRKSARLVSASEDLSRSSRVVPLPRTQPPKSPADDSRDQQQPHATSTRSPAEASPSVYDLRRPLPISPFISPYELSTSPSIASSPILSQPPEGSSSGTSTSQVLPSIDPDSSAESTPYIVPGAHPEPPSTTFTEVPSEIITVVDYASTPPKSLSRAETEHAAIGTPPIQQSDSIEQHGQDEPQLSTKMSSHPDEAFVAPMMFPPLKYTLNYTRRKRKLACPNPVLNNHAVSPPVAMEAPPVLVMVDNASSADTTIPQNNSIDPHQEAVVALPSSSGVMRDPSANPSEGEQLVSTALLGDRTITPTSEPTSIGCSFSNSRDASPIDDPIPPIGEVGSAIPIPKSSSDDCAAGDSNKYLEFFGYDTGTDEWPPVLQQPTAYLESTSDHSQTWPAESGAILVSQCDDHVGIVSVHRFASIGWQEHLLLDGTRYFSNATLHVVTDLDLHKSEELDAVTSFLDGPDTEILPPPQWELWLRDGNESRRGFILVKAWVHHGARMVASKHPGSDLDGHVNEAIDKMESEFEYWQYVVSHPVHALLPPATIAEAVEILTWIYNCWLALSPHHSQLPFSQEECQELLTQLRSFSHTSAETKSLVRTCVVSTVLARVVAWRQGRHWDCATSQGSRQGSNDPSDTISLPCSGEEFTVFFVCSGLSNVSWNDHIIIKVSARNMAYAALVIISFSLGRLLA